MDAAVTLVLAVFVACLWEFCQFMPPPKESVENIFYCNGFQKGRVWNGNFKLTVLDDNPPPASSYSPTTNYAIVALIGLH